MRRSHIQVHPYTNMAWSILSVVPKVCSSCTLHIYFNLKLSQIILAQVDRDSCIVRLVDIMDDVFSFVKEAEPIKKIKSHGQIIELMSQQATECAYFIRDYAMNKSLCRPSSTLHECLTVAFLTRDTNPQQFHVGR